MELPRIELGSSKRVECKLFLRLVTNFQHRKFANKHKKLCIWNVKSFQALSSKAPKGAKHKCFTLGPNFWCQKFFVEHKKNLCSKYGGAFKFEVLKLHQGPNAKFFYNRPPTFSVESWWPSTKKLTLSMLLNIRAWSSESRTGAEHKFLYVWPLLNLCGLAKEKMHSASNFWCWKLEVEHIFFSLAFYESPKELVWEIHERPWNFFSFDL